MMETQEQMVSNHDLLEEFNATVNLYTVHIGMSPNGENPSIAVFHERSENAEMLQEAYKETYEICENELANDIAESVSKFYFKLRMMEGK